MVPLPNGLNLRVNCQASEVRHLRVEQLEYLSCCMWWWTTDACLEPQRFDFFRSLQKRSKCCFFCKSFVWVWSFGVYLVYFYIVFVSLIHCPAWPRNDQQSTAMTAAMTVRCATCEVKRIAFRHLTADMSQTQIIWICTQVFLFVLDVFELIFCFLTW